MIRSSPKSELRGRLQLASDFITRYSTPVFNLSSSLSPVFSCSSARVSLLSRPRSRQPWREQIFRRLCLSPSRPAVPLPCCATSPSAEPRAASQDPQVAHLALGSAQGVKQPLRKDPC